MRKGREGYTCQLMSELGEIVQAVSALGKMVDVTGDGNCGYYAMKELLIEKNILSRNVKISEIRRSIYDFATDNRSVLQQHPYMRQYGFHTLFESEINKIYNNEYDFDSPPVAFEYWFKAEFVLPVASLVYGVEFGTYNLQSGSTKIFDIS